ncbi:MAG: hypothetical protein FWE94_02360 [Coriobacteriia bacterium]|nr:hypothetical protein [Coriobacteriia bacterium]
MRQRPKRTCKAHRVLRCIVAGALLSLCICGTNASGGAAFAPKIAVAAPAGTSSADSIEEKKAEEALALAELERMREELADLMQEYVATSRRIEQTQGEINQVTAEIEEQNNALSKSQQALHARAIELYRGDQVRLIQLLFSAGSISELIDLTSYLTAVARRDAELVDTVRTKRQESLYLQESLARSIDQLTSLQAESDAQQERIEERIDLQQERATQLGKDVARMMSEAAARRATMPGIDPDSDFTPDTIIADARFRATSTMNAAQIQAFLEKQPGALATYQGPDYQGQTKSAAQMISEAANAWQVNPEVILVTLQKEQSLLSSQAPMQRAYDWAMGCGKTDSSTLIKYEGFGNQIWYGAKSLDAHAKRWKPGTRLTINGSVVMPTNSATYALYRYTPHLHGNTSFWMLFWRYFGDPLKPGGW